MANRIPKILNRHFLRDAFVKIGFETQASANLVPGILYNRLQSSWAVQDKGLKALTALGIDAAGSLSEITTLTSEGYRMDVLERRITFNIQNDYPGWRTSYLPLLERTIPRLLEGNLMKIKWVGLRYINDLEGKDIFQVTDRFVTKPFLGYEPKGQAIRTSLIRDGVGIVLNVSNNVRTLNDDQYTSVVDVDLEHKFQDTVDSSEILQILDKLHILNKQLVFGEILPEEFVADFGPTY